MTARIFDCFMFHSEVDVLACRLEQLGAVVDRFVVVECGETHLGAKKGSAFDAHASRFDPWRSQIERVWVESLRATDPREREHEQREWIRLGLERSGARARDVVIQSDVDEVLRVTAVGEIAGILSSAVAPRFVAAEMAFHPFAVDWLYPKKVRCSTAARFEGVDSFWQMRQANAGDPFVGNAGWHFSWLGGRAHHVQKIESIYEGPEIAPYARPMIDADANWREGVHVDGVRLIPVEVDATFPAFIRERRCPENWFRPRLEGGPDAGARAELTVHPDARVRGEARGGFAARAQSARDAFGADVRPIDFKPPEGHSQVSPSVYVGAGRRVAFVRTMNYAVTSAGRYAIADGGGIFRSVNYALEFDDAWGVVQSTRVEDATGVSERGHGFRAYGFEDCRLWRDEQRFCASATVRGLSPEQAVQDPYYGSCEMALLQFDDAWRVVEVDVVRDYGRDRMQKNWMPVVGRPRTFVYGCDPTVVVERFRTGTVERARSRPPVCLSDLRGGSQLIPYDDGYLCVTHEVAWRPERVYLHRFVRFGPDFQVTAVTAPFCFLQAGLEICAGLARDDDRLVASFGAGETTLHLAFFTPAVVDRALRPVAALPAAWSSP